MTWARILDREATEEEREIVRAKMRETAYCKRQGKCDGCAFLIQFEGCWLRAGASPSAHDLLFFESVGGVNREIN